MHDANPHAHHVANHVRVYTKHCLWFINISQQLNIKLSWDIINWIKLIGKFGLKKWLKLIRETAQALPIKHNLKPQK